MADKHPDRTSLLRTILSYPGDDAPRLVYADWLTENGEEERAELIRDQIGDGEAAPLSEPIPMASALGSLVGMPIEPRGQWLGEFWLHRGFVRKIKLFHVPFMRLAKHFFENHPIESVELVGKTPFACYLPQEGGTSQWHGWRISAGEDESSIPIVLFNFLPEPHLSLGAWEKYYRTREDSMHALGRSCVRYGRTLAGIIG